MIKLGVFDLDGTLLTSNGNLPNSFSNDVNELKDLGVKVAIASARPSRFLFELFDNDVDLLISGEDGNIFYHGRELLKVRYLDMELINRVKELVKDNVTLALGFSGLNELYVSNKDYERFIKRGLKRFMPEEPKDLRGDEKICKIHLFCSGGVDEAKRMIDDELSSLKEFCDLQESGYGWIGIMNKNSNKTTAIQFFKEYLNITEDEIAVFGDSSNDIPMFETVKYSFAMKNASSDIKEKALFVTKEDNDHNGAMKALKELALSLNK